MKSESVLLTSGCRTLLSESQTTSESWAELLWVGGAAGIQQQGGSRGQPGGGGGVAGWSGCEGVGGSGPKVGIFCSTDDHKL